MSNMKNMEERSFRTADVMIIRILAIIVAFFIFMTVLSSWWSSDGILGILWATYVNDDTRYAKEYSEDGFRSIAIGMTYEQVKLIIGDPISEWRIDEDKSTIRKWTYSKNSKSYRLRLLEFRENKVYSKKAYFYFD